MVDAVLTVACFLWFDPQGRWNQTYVYTPEHVRLLKNQVSRFLTVPHKFVCITDRKDIDKSIETVPLDKTTFMPGTRFCKLMIFRPDIAKLLGERFLTLDLDTVIVSNINALVERDEDLVLWRNPNFGRSAKRARYNTSIILHRAGTRTEFWDRFDKVKTPAAIRRAGLGGTDQAWISLLASPDEAHWESTRDGVYGLGSMGETLPPNAKIVFSPGRRDFGMKQIQQRHSWVQEYRH